MGQPLDLAEYAFIHLDTDAVRGLARSLLEVPPTDLILRYHPLGFLKFVYAFDGDRRLQLHVWHPKYSRLQIPPQTCHSHGWRLSSYVICGCLIDRYYEVRKTPGGDHVLYGVVYDEGRSDGSPRASLSQATEERYSVTEAREYRRQADNFYSIEPEEFHWTDAVGFTSTLSFGHLANATPARTARRRGQARTHKYERDRVPPENVAEIISRISASLSAKS
jgi:hypothetical protein